MRFRSAILALACAWHARAQTPSPTSSPSASPTTTPTSSPTLSPTPPTAHPTRAPVAQITHAPTSSGEALVYLNAYDWSFQILAHTERYNFVTAVANDIHATSKSALEFTVTERSIIPLSVYESDSNKTELAETIRTLRGLPATATLSFDLGTGRRLQTSGTVILQVVYTVSETEYVDLVNSGFEANDPAFIQSLETTLGLSAGSVSITYDSYVFAVRVTLYASEFDGIPLTETDIQSIVNQKPAVDSIVSAAFANESTGGEDSVTLTGELDLCFQRTTVYPNCESCVATTGVCNCAHGWFGVSCTVEAICQNGGTLDPANFCSCVYPYYGQLCESMQNCTCV